MIIAAAIAAVAVAGVSALVNYFGSKAAGNAGTVNISAIPGPYQPSPVNIGGTQVTGSSQLMNAKEMALAQQDVERMAANIQAMMEQMVPPEQWVPAAGSPGGVAGELVPGPLSDSQMAQIQAAIERDMPPEVKDRLERYDVATTAIAEGSGYIDENGSMIVTDSTRVSDLFAAQMGEDARAAQAGTAEDIQSRYGVGVSQMGAIDRLNAPDLEQQYLNQYRDQSAEDRQRLAELAQQNDYSRQYYGAQGRLDREAGLETAQDYLAQITGQEASLQDVIAGNAPSVAVLERQRALEQTQAANASMAASARDPNAWRAALNANADAGGQAAYDAALLRAQEITTARGQLADVTGQRGALQDYYSQLYGTEVGAAGNYAALQGQAGSALADATASYGALELGAAQSDQEAAMANQELETRAKLDAQAQMDAYEAERRRQGDAAALGYYGQGWSALNDQAQADIALQGIAASSANQYGANVSGALGGNADRGVGVANAATAGYSSALSSGLGTFATMYEMGQDQNGGGGSWGSNSGSKWGSLG